MPAAVVLKQRYFGFRGASGCNSLAKLEEIGTYVCSRHFTLLDKLAEVASL